MQSCIKLTHNGKVVFVHLNISHQKLLIRISIRFIIGVRITMKCGADLILRGIETSMFPWTSNRIILFKKWEVGQQIVGNLVHRPH
jgi:hypothetical protein